MHRTTTAPHHHRRRALLLLLALIAALGVAPPPSAGQDAPRPQQSTAGHLQILRYAGATRTDTARLIGTDAATAGFGGTTVLVARADAFPDSLAGSYLAGVLDAPVLLTPTDGVSPDLEAAIAEIDPDSIVLLGGEAALGPAVASHLAAGHAVQRIAGIDRFATAAAIARQIGAPSPAAQGLAIVASGEAFPDALAAGAIAAAEEVPLLLTGRDRLPEDTAAALRDLAVSEVVLAGGPAAVSPDVEAAIADLGIDVVRAAGANRQDTARALAELATSRFGWTPDRVSLVSGGDFPDAIAMAPHAGLRAGGATPLVLTGGASLGVESTAWLADLAGCDVMGIDVGGGEAAVPVAVVEAAAAALTPAGGCDAPVDATAPTIAFATPGEGAQVVSGADGVELAGSAEDEGSGIVRVELRVDVLGDVVIGTAVPDQDGPFAWSIDATPADPGTYRFTATAVDGAGNQSVAERTVQVTHPSPDATLVFDDVRVLDAEGRACVAEAGPSDVLLTCDPAANGVQGTGPALTSGDVIVSEPTDAAPDGLLRRLGACTAEGSAQRCSAPPVPLTEVFAQVDITAQVPATPTGGAIATAADGVVIEPVGGGTPSGPAPIDPSIDRPAIITGTPTAGFGSAGPPSAAFQRRLVDEHWRTTFIVDLGEEAGLPIPLVLEGTLEAFFYVDLALDIDIEWCWGVVPCGAEVEHFKVELGGGERLEASYDLGGTGGGGDIEVDPRQLGSIDLGSLTFTIGPIPVVISAELGFEIGIDGTIQGAISGRATQSLTLATGIEYRDGDWHDLSRVDWDHDFSRVVDTGSVIAQVRPFVGVDLTLEIYGVDGPYVRGEPYLLADVDSTRNPLFTLHLGFRAAAGIEVDTLGIDYEAELLDVRTLVATSANYPPTSPPAVVIVGPDGFPLEASPGFDQIGVGLPRQAFCCDVLLDYSADLSGAPESPDALYVRWTARNVDTDQLRPLGEAEPGIARLTLPPGLWDITGQVATRQGDNVRGVADVVRVRVLEQTEVAIDPVSPDDPGALALAQAAAGSDADLVTGARFEEVPGGDVAAHGIADPGPCGPGTPATRACPSGLPGLGGGAVLTTGSAAALPAERNPVAPASPGSQGPIAQGVRGDSDTDVTVLAIDVDVPETASCLRFTYRHASEELPDYVGSRFNDAFVAELDASTWTTSGGELVAPDDFARTDAGRQVTTNGLFGPGVDALNATATTYEQATRLLQAATPVTPGPHTLFLSILDQGDASYDSAVVLGDLEAVTAPASACTSGLAPQPSGPDVG